MASCQLPSSLTHYYGQEPVCLNLSCLPFFQIGFQFWVIFIAAGACCKCSHTREKKRLPTLAHSNLPLWLHSFHWGSFAWTKLDTTLLFAFHPCWIRGSVYFLSLQNPCPRTLPSRSPKGAATLSGQQAHLKVQEQCVKSKFYPTVFQLAHHKDAGWIPTKREKSTQAK